MNKLSKTELEVFFNLVLRKLSIDKIEDILFDMNEYWIITTDEWNEFKQIPVPAVGSLEEDIRYIKKSIANNEIISYVDLDRLASVLRAISEIKAPVV